MPFKPSDYTKSEDRFPTGEYLIEIRGCQWVAGKEGSGKSRMVVPFRIEAGPYAGKGNELTFTYENPDSPKAERIGRQQLGQLIEACGWDRDGEYDEHDLNNMLTGRVIMASMAFTTTTVGDATYTNINVPFSCPFWVPATDAEKSEPNVSGPTPPGETARRAKSMEEANREVSTRQTTPPDDDIPF